MSNFSNIPIVVGPNEDQKKKSKQLHLYGIFLLICGGFLFLFEIYLLFNYPFEVAESEEGLLSLIICTPPSILLAYGLKNISKGSKLISIKFTGYIDDMSPYEFELLVEDIYSKMGYECKNLKRSGDSGADVIATKNSQKYVIQAKHYNVNNKVGSRIIRNLYGAIKMHDANSAIIVTTSYFIKPAIKSAHKMGIELIDRNNLKNLVFNNYNVDTVRSRTKF